MSNSRVYEVQELVPFKGWKCLTKPRSDLGVALDEFRAHARTTSASARLRVLNTATGRVLRTHNPAKSTGKSSSPSSKKNDGGTNSSSSPNTSPELASTISSAKLPSTDTVSEPPPPKRKRQPRSVSSSTPS